MDIIVPNTKYIGKNLIFLKSVDSTNSYAKELLTKSNPKNGSVILAEFQTNGRGQLAAQWLAEPNKNLLCSIILNFEHLEIKHQYYLNMAIAIAVREMLANLIEKQPIYIKWPNDILINSKKVCGILIENILQQHYIKHSIIGIGLNVNQEEFYNLPDATSIFIETQQEQSLSKIVQELFYNIEQLLLELKKHSVIKQRYLSYLYWLDEWHDFEYQTKIIHAKILGINEYGQLQLLYNNALVTINPKEIKFLK